MRTWGAMDVADMSFLATTLLYVGTTLDDTQCLVCLYYIWQARSTTRNAWSVSALTLRALTRTATEEGAQRTYTSNLTDRRTTD